jgi:hypothetical protein
LTTTSFAIAPDAAARRSSYAARRHACEHQTRGRPRPLGLGGIGDEHRGHRGAAATRALAASRISTGVRCEDVGRARLDRAAWPRFLGIFAHLRPFRTDDILTEVQEVCGSRGCTHVGAKSIPRGARSRAVSWPSHRCGSGRSQTRDRVRSRGWSREYFADAGEPRDRCVSAPWRQGDPARGVTLPRTQPRVRRRVLRPLQPSGSPRHRHWPQTSPGGGRAPRV